MVDGLKATTAGSSSSSGGLMSLAGSATNAGGAVGAVQSKLAALGPAGAAAAAALGVAVIAITATVGALYSMASAAIEVISQRAQLVATFAALGGGATAGAQTLAMVQKLGDQLPISTAQLGEWAQAMQRAGFSGGELEKATKAIAAASALNPAGGAAAAQETLSKLASGGKEATDLVKAVADGSRKGTGALREMGLTLADVGGKAAVSKMSAEQLGHAMEAALQKKGAGPLDAMSLSLPVMLGKVKEGFSSLFTGLGPAVTPFMTALKSLFGLFDKGSGDMGKLRSTVTAVFTPLFSIATSVAKVLKSMFAGFGDSAKGASGGITETLTKLAAFLKTPEGMQKIRSALETIGTVAKYVAIGFGLIAAVCLAIGAGIGVVIGVVGAFAAGVVNAVAQCIAGFGQIGDAIGGLDIGGTVSGWIASLADLATGAMDAASNFVAGLVDGIAAGAGAVASAVKGLASGALSAFTGALGIHSPSTIMLEHGEDNIAGAAATGVDKGAPKMGAAMAKLGAPPGKGGAARAGSGAGAGASFSFTGCTFGGGLTQESVNEMMTAWWEQLAQSGPEAEPS